MEMRKHILGYSTKKKSIYHSKGFLFLIQRNTVVRVKSVLFQVGDCQVITRGEGLGFHVPLLVWVTVTLCLHACGTGLVSLTVFISILCHRIE